MKPKSRKLKTGMPKNLMIYKIHDEHVDDGTIDVREEQGGNQEVLRPSQIARRFTSGAEKKKTLE